jgi:MerR family transcriptional regulator, heat shock protein HspR
MLPVQEEFPEPVRGVYRIGTAAELLGVHPRTLRLYEERGLVVPARKHGQRLYSQNDIRWLRCLRRLIHEEGYGLDAIVKLLDFAPCWELRDCPPETRTQCEASRDRRLRCWQIAERTCRHSGGSCEQCEVYQRDKAIARGGEAVSE